MTNELLKKIWDLKSKKEELELKTQSLSNEIKDLDLEIDNLNSSLLIEMKSNSIKQFDDNENSLVAEVFSRENVSYKDEKEVIKWLKQNCQSNYIKIKTTESIDKTALKKELKTNPDLARELETMTERTLTEYVVVTTKENHQKMLEHINSNK